MTISELGSLGEFVASVAVLVSLVILIFQVRGAKAEFSSQITRDLKSNNNQAFRQLTSQPGLVDLHIRAQRDFQSLSETEAHTWMTWLFTWITQTEEGWKERERGVPNMDFVDGYLLGVALVLRSEGGAIVWPRLRVFFDEGFNRTLEAVMREDDTTHLDLLLGDASSGPKRRTPI
jgi:hypothetical protein